LYLSSRQRTGSAQESERPWVYPSPRRVIARLPHQISHQKAEDPANQGAVEEARDHDARGAGNAVGVGRGGEVDQEHREKGQVIVLVVEPATRDNNDTDTDYFEQPQDTG